MNSSAITQTSFNSAFKPFQKPQQAIIEQTNQNDMQLENAEPLQRAIAQQNQNLDSQGIIHNETPTSYQNHQFNLKSQQLQVQNQIPTLNSRLLYTLAIANQHLNGSFKASDETGKKESLITGVNSSGYREKGLQNTIYTKSDQSADSTQIFGSSMCQSPILQENTLVFNAKPALCPIQRFSQERTDKKREEIERIQGRLGALSYPLTNSFQEVKLPNQYPLKNEEQNDINSITRDIQIDNFDISKIKVLDYEDLNDCVSALLKKAKEDQNDEYNRKKRQRKNKQQLKILENEYAKNPDWTREYIRKLAESLGLSECQVYKWRWDQLKKINPELTHDSMN
eukprot:403344370